MAALFDTRSTQQHYWQPHPLIIQSVNAAVVVVVSGMQLTIA